MQLSFGSPSAEPSKMKWQSVVQSKIQRATFKVLMNACRAITKECKRRKKADDKLCNHPATLKSQELARINIIVNGYRA